MKKQKTNKKINKNLLYIYIYEYAHLTETSSPPVHIFLLNVRNQRRIKFDKRTDLEYLSVLDHFSSCSRKKISDHYTLLILVFNIFLFIRFFNLRHNIKKKTKKNRICSFEVYKNDNLHSTIVFRPCPKLINYFYRLTR